MDPFSLATACYAVISSCVKVSRRLNQLIEDSREDDELIQESLAQTRCLHRVLRAINNTLLNNPTSTSFLTKDSDASALREAMKQAIIGSGSAVARFEGILNAVLPSPKALGLARKAMASHRLRERSNEILHIRQQMQTYAGILQMALQTVTVSLLLRGPESAPSSPTKLTSKVSRLLKSIHSAEQSLALPIMDHLDPAQITQFGRCTRSAHAVASTASSVLEHSRSVTSTTSRQIKSENSSEWGFTFLESESTDPPIVHVNLAAVDKRSQIEDWIKQRHASKFIDNKSDLDRQSISQSVLLEKPWLLPATAPQSEIGQDDSVSCTSSDDSLNLDAGLSRIFLDLGEQSLEGNRFSQAETYFRKALDKSRSSSSLAHRQDIEQKIGICCLEQGKYEEATAIFDKTTDLVDSVVERMFAKAQKFYDSGEYQCTNNCLRRVLADPKDTPDHIIREMQMLSGSAFLAVEDLDGAEAQFVQVLLPNDQPGDSRSFEAHHRLALVDLKRGEMKQAIFHARTASDGRWRLFGKHHEASQDSLALLADIFEAEGDTEEAEAHSRLLTVDNLKKRRTQLRLTSLRRRLARLHRGSYIVETDDTASFADELEHFLVGYVSLQDGCAETVDDDNSLLLIRATQERRLTIVRVLLRDSDTNLQGCDELGNTALHHAVHAGFEEIAALLLNRVGDGINLANNAGETALTIATRNEHETILHLLLRRKKLAPNLEVRKQVDSKTISHGPALHIAVINQSESIVDLFLRKAPRININRLDAQGRTPIHYAILSGNTRICEMLLNRPTIDVNRVTDAEQQSPLALAISKDMDRIARRLISSRDVDVNKKDYQGHTALHHSAWANRPGVMAYLLERRSIDVNAKDLCGRTALHIAATYGNRTLVKLLLGDVRVDINCTTDHRETPRAAALSANHKAVAALLERSAITVRLSQYGL